MKAKKSLGLPREVPRSRRRSGTKWGQNFLRDPKILKKVADFARIEKGDTVVEVGPGEGTLTKFLLERAGMIIAVEKDEKLAEELQDKFREEILDNRLQIIVGDVLDYNLSSTNYKLIGNIPYYITGEIFRKFLQSNSQPKSITFVVQKEVAGRIMAKDGKESVLSISIKAYGTPEYGGVIKAGSFSPAPKVDSAIISVRNISKKRFGEITHPSPLLLQERGPENHFFEILKKGFAHKRKLLAKNLGVSRGTLDTLGLSEKVRAEDLSTDDWFILLKYFLNPEKE